MEFENEGSIPNRASRYATLIRYGGAKLNTKATFVNLSPDLILHILTIQDVNAELDDPPWNIVDVAGSFNAKKKTVICREDFFQQ